MFKIRPRYWTIILCSILADQYTKIIAVEHLSYHQPVSVLPFLNFFLTYNEGAAFSLLSDADGWQRWFLSVLAICISVYIVFWLFRLRNQDQIILSIGLSLVLGGAIGNVIDRIQLGYVIDYIQVFIMGWPFPSFNIADASVTIGIVLFIYYNYIQNSKLNNEPEEI